MPHAESPETAPDAPAEAVMVPTVEEEKPNLEDMFDSESDGDEFNSSAPNPAPVAAAPAAKSGGNQVDDETMRQFYQRLFPFRFLFQWLNHSPAPTTDFMHREFAFTLPNDAYLRYQSFPSADMLRKQCMQQVPSRFEIGPVYSTNPRDRKTVRKSSMFRPISKELVFDIDMTDYDPIRTCCQGTKICNRCWSWITMAIKVVDVALRDDFGFKHILWVYSGRRGAHAWVCDRRAREMDDSRRKAIAGYFELLKGGDKGGKKVNAKRPLHPHLERSLKVLREHFQTDILIDQDPFLSEAQSTQLLNLLPDPTLNASLSKKWSSAPDRPSTSKWTDIDSLASTGTSKTLDPKALKEAKQDIVLEYTYPRLDTEVSKKLNHLLKSPFCVHPGTGRVCVPIDTRKLEEFDPFAVPTVTELLGQIDMWDVEHKGEDKEGEEGKKIADWEKTALKGYVDFFRGFVAGLLKDEKGGKREREEGTTAGADAMEF
ncbi:prim-pol domain-containing protein [Tothia fuscella]|uniref:DNA primase n=1 Tax=Tothia fuscella TaxID=1048955 RepID=A0A9P4U435_9PEZI|nr:prim-pol domain-containing protein [Tothia fuscella]